MIHTALSHVRYATFVLGLIAFILMTASSIVRKDLLSRRTRRVWVWLYLLVGNVVYGTATHIRDHAPLITATYISFVIMFGLVIALLWNPEDDDEKLPDGSPINVKFVHWLDRRVRAYKESKEWPMKGKTYDRLKSVALLYLPVLGTVYYGLAHIWGLPKADEVVGSIVVIDTALGGAVHLSGKAFRTGKREAVQPKILPGNGD